MASPPRSVLQPLIPSTPKKPFRARPRTVNRPAREKCRKCLFGPPDHAELTKWLREELRTLNSEKSVEWNFDFEMGKPLSGGDWQWERIALKDRDRPLCLPKSPMVGEVAGFSFPSPSKRLCFGANQDKSDHPLEATPMVQGENHGFVTDENASPASTPSTSSCPYPSTRSRAGRSASECEDGENASPLTAATPLSPASTAARASVTPTRRHAASGAASTSVKASRKTQIRQGGVAQRRLQEFYPIKRRAADSAQSSNGKRIKQRLVFESAP